MHSPLPPHIWFVRGRYYGGAAYHPAGRGGLFVLLAYAGVIAAIVVAVVVLSLRFERGEFWFFAGGGVAAVIVAFRFAKIIKAHADMSISIQEYRVRRAAAKEKRGSVRDR